MSRGSGKVERAILEVLKEKGHCPALNLLVYHVAEKLGELRSQEQAQLEYGRLRGKRRNPLYTESFYRSVARAVRRLKEKELVYSGAAEVQDMVPCRLPNENECVLGAGSPCYREVCRYWDRTLQECIYRQIKEQERKKRHDERFKDERVEERIRLT